jgi:hypothetical protein
MLLPNSLKRLWEDSGEGIKDYDPSCRPRDIKDIEAEIQRQVKQELLRMDRTHLPQSKQQKTKRVEQVVVELGEETD